MILAGRTETLDALRAEIERRNESNGECRKMAPAVFSDCASAGESAEADLWDLVLAETDLPGARKLLERMLADRPEMPLGLIGPPGAHGAATGDLSACGAEFFGTPIDRRRLAAFLDAFAAPMDEGVIATVASGGDGAEYRIAGADEAFVEVVNHAMRIASTSVPVLITGESGTGKELISQLIHCRSARRDNPLVTVNCAALSDSLLESELFGHERGAFTGACRRRTGHFEQAHGGTIILDEISETSRKLQAELLRVLEQQEFKRLGGTEDVRVNVRVVATTNRDLQKQVRKGNFRKDLYYRLSVVRLKVPPLRQRTGDIPVLVRHFVNLYSPEARRRISRLDDEMMQLFERHDWPGNVRQLRNVVRSAMLFGSGPVLSLENTPLIRAELTGTDGGANTPTLHLKELEKQAILEALRRTRRNQAKAAELLGITDRTLREKLRKYSRCERPGQKVAAGENK